MREIDTIMTQNPIQKNVESVLAGLGYKLEATSKNNKKTNKLVNLEKKQNKRDLLSLAYYSISLVQHMVMDIVICKILLFRRKSSQNKITIAELEDHVALMGHLFRNEYNDRDTRPHSVMVKIRV